MPPSLAAARELTRNLAIWCKLNAICLARAHSKHSPAPTFALLHAGRSGSTVLGDLLAQHPRIDYAGEPFEALKLLMKWKIPVAHLQTPLRDRLCRRETKSRPLGFAWSLEQSLILRGGVEDAWRWLVDGGCGRFIFLQRRNLLRKYISGRIAATTGIWNRRRANTDAFKPIRIDIQAPKMAGGRVIAANMLEKFQLDESYYATLHELMRASQTSHVQWLHLIYEDDIMPAPEAAYKKVCAFLGLEAQPVQVRLARLNARPLRELVSNYDEVAAHLSSTPYATMLED